MAAFKGLTDSTTFVLIAELDDTVGLALAGLRAARGARFDAEDYPAVLTLLSTAMEKALKIALGLHYLDIDSPWPSKAVMKGHGHNIVKLWAEVHGIYMNRLAAGNGLHLASASIASTHADPVATVVLDVLSRWGIAGRFERLDELAGRPQSGPAIRDLTDLIEHEVIRRDPSILADLADVKRPDAWDPAHDRAALIVFEAMRDWWKAHVDAWATGVLGDAARVLSGGLRRVLMA